MGQTSGFSRVACSSRTGDFFAYGEPGQGYQSLPHVPFVFSNNYLRPGVVAHVFYPSPKEAGEGESVGLKPAECPDEFQAARVTL